MARPLTIGNCKVCNVMCKDGMKKGMCRPCYDRTRNAALTTSVGMTLKHPRILDALTRMEKDSEFLTDFNRFSSWEYLAIHKIIKRALDDEMNYRTDIKQREADQLDAALDQVQSENSPENNIEIEQAAQPQPENKLELEQFQYKPWDEGRKAEIERRATQPYDEPERLWD